MGSGEPLVRVVAVDAASVTKAALVLTMANTMAKQDIGQMLSFQPTLISGRSAEPPTIPEGATVFYAARIAAGDILTDNSLLVTAETKPDALARAIIARVSTAGHTVLECLGRAATAQALQAVISARRGLLVRTQDVACVIASTYVNQQPRQATQQQQPRQREGEEGEQQQPQQQAAEGRRGKRRGAAGAAATGPGGGEAAAARRVLANRIVVLECAPRDPSLLRVRSTYGKVGS
ncbi:hypothetical protein MNEG_7113 [Monoraphidium neglectum]|uniref:Uncharacterized protein n=1 Tax=Monoraphidium neglectum TaxID=145388 RepID=A0A0D2L092_9CHLO|nr:hypothetical protein MNEG_7113 [Monoraphidium neglectum]KIZ00849.1 hypothetical protein MNEG_7113 [Monoraphidium neglectum]|eukprot:XP_013899868.1 hypothetical protein MNEG_7113 [Monoraphidium neglectum]